jgi:hypothetical protein
MLPRRENYDSLSLAKMGFLISYNQATQPPFFQRESVLKLEMNIRIHACQKTIRQQKRAKMRGRLKIVVHF